MNATRRDVLVGSAVALAASGSVPSQAYMGPAMASPPTLDWVFSAKVTLAPAIEKGIVDGLRKRFIAITGGELTGPKLSGTILPGGGDWQTIHPDGITELDARYALKANDGTVISVINPGIRVASPDVINRIAAGENVDPSLYYFRTTPRFEVPAGPHDWLRRSIFVARGVRRPDHVRIECFRVS
jgi:Protein of unknown function (DUF3237)